MVGPARRAAFEILCRIETGDAHSDDLLHSEDVRVLEQRDRNLVTELVYGTLRWRGLLDHVLSGVSSRSWEDVDVPVRCALRMGVYQMCYMDRVPDHAVVSDAVEVVRARAPRGSDGFVNAVLRALSRAHPWTNPGYEAGLPAWVRVSLPEWLWRRWSLRYGDEAAGRYAISLNRPPQAAWRIAGSTRCVPDPAWIASDVVPGAFLGSARGDPAADVQYLDEASQLMPHLLGVGPGWAAWDACAAPGGKSMVLAELAGPAGHVVSSDVSLSRAAFMKRRLAGFGALRAQIIVCDASMRLPFRRHFDAVLVDAPCSGLGTLRRNPEIKWRCCETGLAVHHRTQLGILSAACEAVRPGGRLLYSTCSTEPEENESVIGEFLAGRSDFSLARPSGPGGIEAWSDGEGYTRTFPSDRLWDGFFAALLDRSDPSGAPSGARDKQGTRAADRRSGDRAANCLT